jgi:release factor glutamine methyltransferase
VPATAGSALQAARDRLAVTSQNPRRDVEVLLRQVLQCDAAALLTHPERLLSADESAQFENFVSRRAACEPIQYILGVQEFFGLPFAVTPDVLIPRPETEHLVEAVLQRVNPQADAHILDVGTGSGAIAVALAYALPQAHLTAVDLSSAALAVARRNAERHGVVERVTFLQSDLLAAFDRVHFDVVVSNPPYIAAKEVLEPQVAQWEPRSALYAGATGLEIYVRLIPQARKALKPNGWLLLEIGYGQSPAIRKLLSDWTAVNFLNDLQGIPRVAVARR